MKKFLLMTIVGIGSGYFGAYLFEYQKQDTNEDLSYIKNVQEDTIFATAQPISLPRTEFIETNTNLVDASASSTQSVVYIKNISEKVYRMSFMDLFFDEGVGQATETISSGSGVIFSSDGYIVTNNHVIADADKLEVIHGKNNYEATLIGVDPSTDLAVLKIDGKGLPVLPIGSSRNLNVGEWVIAVGNPFNLTSTVTAGIVSAKARALNIVKEQFPIESFIQTDAAINPGNSGGALVNSAGELVGINTAILSRTGSYAGYGFAVPVDIVKKIVEDLIEYGEVQKAFVGAEVSDLTEDIVTRLDLKIDVSKTTGVVVNTVQKGWAAQKANIAEGDVIISIDGTKIDSRAEFDEVISYHSPGDNITITLLHNGKVSDKKLILTNREGTTGVIKREIFASQYLGADLENVSKVELDLFGIEHGVKIVKLYSRGLLPQLDLEEDFIITFINNHKVDSPQALADVFSNIHGRVRVEGVNKAGVKGYYTYYLR